MLNSTNGRKSNKLPNLLGAFLFDKSSNYITVHSPLTALFLPHCFIILRLGSQIISQGLKVVDLGIGEC